MASTTERGYGFTHQQERKRWAPIVRAGRAVCWRCRRPIHPQARWDLGHDDHDRQIWRGPEHLRCNRGAAARKTNAIRSAKRSAAPRSTVRRAPTITTLEW